MRRDLLAVLAEASAARAAAARRREPWGALFRRAANTPLAPPLRLDGSGFDVIAEVKRRAPSAGTLDAAGGDIVPAVAARARAYAAAGAAAVSVLTEPEAFGGSLAHLAAAAEAAAVPVMRKDVLVDPYQVVEARAAGAGGVLLVVRILERSRLVDMLDACATVGAFALLEAFDAADAARVAEAATSRRHGPVILAGVNARDLVTLAIDRSRAATLYRALPADVPRVAESGMAGPEDAARAAALGYELVLAGTSLMRAPDPAAAVRTLLAAGRAAARPSCASA